MLLDGAGDRAFCAGADLTEPRDADPTAANLGLVLESARSDSEGAKGLRHEAALAALAISSADGQEGVRAFLGKRTPAFDRGES